VSVIVDQPEPIATDRRPTWEMVMAYVEQFRHDTAHIALGVDADVVTLVLADMRERDVLSRSRYGTPLTSGNGRDHLVDAYQECLDACVYFMNELAEHGVIATTHLSKEAFPDRAKRWYLHDVQQLFVSQVRVSINLRAVIEERGPLGQTARKEAL
jgi:hypothetical protein